MILFLLLPFFPDVVGIGATLGALGTAVVLNIREGHPWRIPKLGLFLGIAVFVLFVLPMRGLAGAWSILREPFWRPLLGLGGVIGALLTFFTWEEL